MARSGLRFLIVRVVLALGCTLAFKAAAADLSALSAHFNLQKPEGDGPFPAVMLLPGCSGFKSGAPSYDGAQRRLLEAGFAVLRVDYLSARGKERCDGGAVTTRQGAEDVRAVAAYLRSQPFVKRASINVLGWSYGGGVALDALSDEVLAGVDTVIAYYPLCREVRPWKVRTSVLVLFGEADNVVSLDVCNRIFASLPDAASVRLRTYPDAFHGFDMAHLPPKTEYRFGTLGYNESAAKSAWSELEQFLRR
jgi:dienelactone hydrolase